MSFGAPLWKKLLLDRFNRRPGGRPTHNTVRQRNALSSGRLASFEPLEDRVLLAVFNVDVTAPWRDTGVDVVAGQILQITTDPLQRVAFGGSSRTITADGFGDETFGPHNGNDICLDNEDNTFPAPGAVCISLIGKIGGTLTPDTGTLVPAGTSLFTTTPGDGFVGSSYDQVAPVSGRLFLGFNDIIGATTFGDNSGAFTATITIEDPPVDAVVSIANANDADETGSAPGKFIVTQSAVSPTDTVISYSVLASSTATAGGVDYATLSGTVTIPAGSTTADIDVTGIVDDAIVELDETVTVELDSIISGSPGITFATAVKMEADTLVLPGTFTGSPPFLNVGFQQTYDTAPIVIALSDSNGAQESALRMKNLTTTGFEIVQVEPEFRDGEHAAQNAAYFAIEPGIYKLPDGTIIEAGLHDTTTTVQDSAAFGSAGGHDTVSFTAGFTGTPTVLTFIQTLVNEVSNVPAETSVPWMTTSVAGISSTSFDVALERSEVNDGMSVTSNETIGWVAIQTPGPTDWLLDDGSTTVTVDVFNSGAVIDGWDQSGTNINFNATFSTAPVVVASMASRNDPGEDGGWLRRSTLTNSLINLRVDEDRRFDGERNHALESAAIAAFSQSFMTTNVGGLQLATVTILDNDSATVGSFSGGDVGEGLDLDGSFLYAVNVRGPAAGFVRDANFTDESVPGVDVFATREILNWGTPPEYGATSNDNNLETVMQSIRWTPAPNPVTVTLQNLVAGERYKLQLLMREACCNRGFDVYVEGDKIVDDFNPGIVQGDRFSIDHAAVVTHEFVAPDATLNIALIQPAPFPDNNPILNGFTLEELGKDVDTYAVDEDDALDAGDADGSVADTTASSGTFDGVLANEGLDLGANVTGGDGLFDVSAFRVSGDGGTDAIGLDNTTETLAVWSQLDGVSPPIVGSPVVTGDTLLALETDTETKIHYNGAFGFADSLTYGSINSDGPGGSGGDISTPVVGDLRDFSVRGQTFLAFKQGGIYSISVGSDDGRRIELTAVSATGYTGFIAAGNQEQGGFSVGDTVIHREFPTFHAHTTGMFTVDAGDILKLDTFFWERGDGDQFHVNIKSGADTGGGDDAFGGWSLLTDGALGGAVQIGTANTFVVTLNVATVTAGTFATTEGGEVVMAADGTFTYDQLGLFDALATGETDTDTFTYTVELPSPQFDSPGTPGTFTGGDGLMNVQVINTSSSNPGNNTANWLSVWDALDGGASPTGSVAGFNILNNTSDTETVFDYAGRVANFGVNNAIGTIAGDGPGGGTGPFAPIGVEGVNYSIRGQTYLAFGNAGTYRIVMGSDDGRRIELSEEVVGDAPGYTGFTSRSGQVNGSFSPGDTVIGFSGSTGHALSFGTFTVAAGDVLLLDAFYYEGGGGDSGEISIGSGTGTGSLALLEDGVLDIAIGTTNNFAFTPGAPGVPTTLTGNVTIDINGVNDAPTNPVDSNGATNEVVENAPNGTAVGITASSTDVDNVVIYQESGGMVVGEAEHYTSRSGAGPTGDRWLNVPNESASAGGTFSNARGGEFMQVLPDGNGVVNAPDQEPFLDFQVEIATAGTYQLYVRSEAFNGRSDSFFGSIVESKDGEGGVADWYRFTSAGRDFDFATDPWLGLGEFEGTSVAGSNTAAVWNLSPGTHTLRFTQREDGLALDAWVLQLASLAAPTGVGPDANSALIKYSLTDDAGGRFGIDEVSGVVTVADGSLLDYETNTSHTIKVKATDAHNGMSSEVEFTINVLDEAEITGFVFADVDNDGVFDVEDAPLANVEITLIEAGVDAVFETADDETFTTTTDNDGFYGFEDVAAGKVRIIESGAPADLTDGVDTPDGVIDLDAVNDQFTIDFARTDVNGMNFAEQADAGGLSSGDTATIGFWQNKHGQALIDELDETGELTAWLLDNFDNIFDQADFDEHGGSVGEFYKNEFFKKKLKGTPKVDAQFMAVAFAAFATSSNLSNGAGADFGFNVTDSGIGSTVVNVGDSGAAFGVADNTDMTIMALLLVTNSLTAAGADLIYDDGDNVLTDLEKALRVMANVVYTDINEGGDI